MSDKRSGRTSAITGVGDETASALSPEQLALMGYQIPTTRHMVAETTLPDGAIVPQGDGSWLLSGFRLTTTGVDIPADTTEAQWTALGVMICKLGASVQWLIGDWLAFGDRRWGKTYEQVAELTGYEVQSLRDMVYVASKVSVRTDKLSFAHHKVVAGLAPEDQQAWLEWAMENGASSKMLLAAIREWRRPTPLSSGADGSQVQKVLISREKPREFRQFLKLASKAGQGDVKAKQRALGRSVQYRQWLDEMEQWLKG